MTEPLYTADDASDASDKAARPNERYRLMEEALRALVDCIDWMPSSGFASFVVMDPERLRVARDLLAPSEGGTGK